MAAVCLHAQAVALPLRLILWLLHHALAFEQIGGGRYAKAFRLPALLPHPGPPVEKTDGREQVAVAGGQGQRLMEDRSWGSILPKLIPPRIRYESVTRRWWSFSHQAKPRRTIPRKGWAKPIRAMPAAAVTLAITRARRQAMAFNLAMAMLQCV
jgi:hypothetical protein